MCLDPDKEWKVRVSQWGLQVWIAYEIESFREEESPLIQDLTGRVSPTRREDRIDFLPEPFG